MHWEATSIDPVSHAGVVWPPWQLTLEHVPSELLYTAVPLFALYVLLKSCTLTTTL